MLSANEITNIIVTIIGKAKVSRGQKKQIIDLLDAVTQAKKYEPPPSKDEANDIKQEPNTIPLSDLQTFKFPSEFNLEFEGQEGTQKIKIFPDGMSEAT